MPDLRQENIANVSNHVMMNMTLEEMMDFIYNSLSETLDTYSYDELDELSEMVNTEND